MALNFLNNAEIKGTLDVSTSATIGTDLTLTDGVLTVNDGNNYVKISEGTNSIGEIELKDSTAVYLQGWGTDFRVAVNGTYDNHALKISNAKESTFYGNVVLEKSTPTLTFNNLAGGGLDPILQASGTNFNIATTSIVPLSIDLSTGHATFNNEITTGDDINCPTKVVVGESATAEVRIKKTNAGVGSVKFYNNDGASSTSQAYLQLDASEDLVLYAAANNDALFYAGGDLNLTMSNTTATFTGNLELASSKYIRWGAGDAKIEEGATANYSLDFSTYDGSSMTTALTLLGNNNAYFTGDIYLDDNSGASPSVYFYNGDNDYWRQFCGSSDDLTFRFGTVTKFELSGAGDATLGQTDKDSNTTLNLFTNDGYTSKVNYQETSGYYGFSTEYDGNNNQFHITRHSNSQAGAAVITLNRDDNKIAFNGYGTGSITGTAAYTLAVDSSGNVIETSGGGGGGTIGGSGTQYTIPRFTTTTAIGDSIIKQPNATTVTIDNTSSKVGIRTAYPKAALHNLATTKGRDLNLSEQGFFTPSNGDRYIKTSPYGKGYLFGSSGAENMPVLYGGYSVDGKLLETRRSVIIKVPSKAWGEFNGTGYNVQQSVQLVSAAVNKIVWPMSINVLIDGSTALDSSINESWDTTASGTENFPIRVYMVGGPNGPTNNTQVIGGIPKSVLSLPTGATANQKNAKKFLNIPINYLKNADENFSTTGRHGYWNVGNAATNPSVDGGNSLRLALSNTANIKNSNNVADMYFFVEYVVFNIDNFITNYNRITRSQGSGTSFLFTNARNKFYASNNQQSGICSAQTLPATDTAYWHDGSGVWPKVGDRVWRDADGQTSQAYNGYYYMYSAGGHRWWFRILWDGSGTCSWGAGVICEMDSCAIPAPTS